MKLKSIISAMLALAIMLAALPFAAFAEGEAEGVAIDEANFPDGYFRFYVSDWFDFDENGILDAEEIAEAKKVEFREGDGSEGCESIEGIEYLTELEYLICLNNGCKVAAADLSGNLRLKEIVWQSENLTAIDVSENAELIKLNVSGSGISGIDVSHNPKLEFLACGNTNISAVDVSRNPRLQFLGVAGTDVTALDLSRNNALCEVSAYRSALETIDLRGCASLWRLDLTECGNILSVNISDCVSLHQLLIHGTQISEIDIRNCPKLCRAYCHPSFSTPTDYIYTKTGAGEYGTYTIHINEGIEILYTLVSEDDSNDDPIDVAVAIDENNFPDASFRAFIGEEIDTDKDGFLNKSELAVKQMVFGVYGKTIQSLKGIEYFESLQTLNFAGCPMEKLDLSGNTTITELILWSSHIKTLNLSNCAALYELSCDGSLELTSIDVSYCLYLESIDITHTAALTEIDISTCPELSRISAIGSGITRLDIRKCRYLNETYLKAMKILDEDEPLSSFSSFVSGKGLCFIKVEDEVEIAALIPVDAGDFVYHEALGEYVISKYNGSATELVIPSELDGHKIDVIGENAFAYNETLVSVTIPDGIKTIESNAFFGCVALETVVIPDTVTAIGEAAFAYCDNITGITFPAGIKKISDYMFSWCNKLASFVIPEGVEEIGAYAFSMCSGMKSVTIPSSVKAIGMHAFAGCGFETVDLPESIVTIPDGCFKYCVSLKSFVIPASVRTIENSAFSECRALEQIVIPATVKKLGRSAFSGCDMLETVTLESALTVIGDYTFDSCISLKEIRIPSTVEELGKHAFANCENLETVYLTEYLKGTVAENVFENISPNFVITVKMGDFTGDGGVTSDDAIYLLRHTLFGKTYPVPAGADFTGDGKVTSDDAIYLLRHTLFPNDYPLNDFAADENEQTYKNGKLFIDGKEIEYDCVINKETREAELPLLTIVNELGAETKWLSSTKVRISYDGDETELDTKEDMFGWYIPPGTIGAVRKVEQNEIIMDSTSVCALIVNWFHHTVDIDFEKNVINVVRQPD